MLHRVLFLVILTTFVSAKYTHNEIGSNSSEENILQEWEAFKQKYGKVYADEAEDTMRMHIYMKNKLSIAKHNELYKRGLVSFEEGINEFCDLTDEEFAKYHFRNIM